MLPLFIEKRSASSPFFFSVRSPSFNVELTVSSIYCSRFDSFLSREDCAFAILDSLPNCDLGIWIVVRLVFSLNETLASLPTAHFVLLTSRYSYLPAFLFRLFC